MTAAVQRGNTALQANLAANSTAFATFLKGASLANLTTTIGVLHAPGDFVVYTLRGPGKLLFINQWGWTTIYDYWHVTNPNWCVGLSIECMYILENDPHRCLANVDDGCLANLGGFTGFAFAPFVQEATQLLWIISNRWAPKKGWFSEARTCSAGRGDRSPSQRNLLSQSSPFSGFLPICRG